MSLVLVQGSWRWMVAATLAAILTFATMLTLNAGAGLSLGSGSSSTAGGSSPVLDAIAGDHPGRSVEVIVQFEASGAQGNYGLVRAAGGEIDRKLPIINGVSTTMPAAAAQTLSADPAVHAVSINAAVKSQGGFDPKGVATSYNESIRSDDAWKHSFTGKGVGVAVIDTGIAGDLPDFRVSSTSSESRVIATAVVNPSATSATDTFGHGTHIAGLIAGNGTFRPKGDPLRNRYVGVAPDANLIAVKVADDDGNTTVLDVIDGLQFVVDHKADYNIRVVNLSLASTQAESYLTDPLDAAVEAAWNSGIVVVVAAGNTGIAEDAVSYAPANDPYVITVGGVDDMSTKSTYDDSLAEWSSRGVTQDGFEKPDIVAPGARLVSTIPAGSTYTQLCPTCIVDGSYFQVGGTSMAAAVVSGGVANLLQARPTLTPDQVKSTLVANTRAIDSPGPLYRLVNALGEKLKGNKVATRGGELAVDKIIDKTPPSSSVNYDLTPNSLIDPTTGQIDYTRASWSRASWSDAIDTLRASWSRASWSRASWSRASWSATAESCIEFERASWSRASWSRASWSTAALTPPSDEEIDAQIAAAQADCAELLAQVDPSRASWSRASWSRASWSTSFTK